MTISSGKEPAELMEAITALSLGLGVMLGDEIPAMFINTYDKGHNFVAYEGIAGFWVFYLPLLMLNFVVVAALWLLGGYIGAKFWQQRHRHDVPTSPALDEDAWPPALKM